MSIVELSFASGEDSLSVRTFSVQEAMSSLFQIAVVARSKNDDIDLESIVGKPAMFRIVSGVEWALVGTRLWTGIVSSIEQTRVEPAGLSTYELTIVPALWMLTQRRDHRLFQHISIPGIVAQVLSEWKIAHAWQIERAQYPRLELRVQYGESDYAFVSRLLEEAGISFYVADDFANGSQIVFHDKPQRNEPRSATPIPFFDDPKLAQAAQQEYLTDFRIGHQVRPGRLTIRDFDFRRPGFALYGESAKAPSEGGAGPGIEERMEQYHYSPGAFLTEGHAAGDTPAADDRGVARFHQPAGHGLAQRTLEGQRATKRLVHFTTNAMDLSPGVVFTVGNHPRADLAPDKRLLVKSFTLAGEVGKEWTMTGSATFAAHPYRPQATTPKPKIFGVQSAIVVGPEGESVYTDEFGRVRVQFHWDREGKFNQNSSIWMRVSQGWAGPGYGMINLPRVGHEVLVGFLDGDPDNPLVVGRVFNGTAQVPYKLPDSKLISAWKSDSNSNIILFIDVPEKEGFLEQAEKDRYSVVKHKQTQLIGDDDKLSVHGDEKILVGGDYKVTAIGKISMLSDESSATAKLKYSVSAGQKISMTSGYKWSAGVKPVMPLVLAALSLAIAEEKLGETFPSGPPDLQSVLASEFPGAGGSASAVLALSAEELEALAGLADIKETLKTLLLPLESAIAQLTPAELDKLLEGGPELDDLIDQIQQIAQQNQAPGGPPPPDYKALLAKLKALMAAVLDQPEPKEKKESAADKKAEALKTFKEAFELFEKIAGLLGIEVIPETTISIKHEEIKLKTSGAKISLKKDSIEIEAEGEVKIKGSSVKIEPSPCKCGG